MATMTTTTTAPQDAREAQATAPRLLFTIDQVAETLGISRSMVYRLVWDKELRGVHIGIRHLITAASIHAYVARLLEAGEGGTNELPRARQGPPSAAATRIRRAKAKQRTTPTARATSTAFDGGHDSAHNQCTTEFHAVDGGWR
jgi:excisionase family DNA binding protein